jgi:hypothetical protein
VVLSARPSAIFQAQDGLPRGFGGYFRHRDFACHPQEGLPPLPQRLLPQRCGDLAPGMLPPGTWAGSGASGVWKGRRAGSTKTSGISVSLPHPGHNKLEAAFLGIEKPPQCFARVVAGEGHTGEYEVGADLHGSVGGKKATGGSPLGRRASQPQADRG